MLISVSQISNSQLAAFCRASASGASFSGNVEQYFLDGGFAGSNVCYVSGGDQSVLGIKSFSSSPIVPYIGTSYSAASKLYVDDRDLALSGVLTGLLINNGNASLVAASGVLASQTLLVSGIETTGLNSLSGFTTNMSGAQTVANAALVSSLSGFTTGVSGALSHVHVTGSSGIQNVNLVGLGGTLIIYSGSNVYISGAAAASAGGANGTGIFVPLTGDVIISGFKLFTGNPWVAAPSAPSGVVNYSTLSGVSGVLASTISSLSGFTTAMSGVLSSGPGGTTNNYYITGTGVVAANSAGTVTNTFNITSGNASIVTSGVSTNTYNVTNGNLSTSYSLSGITGNFVNMSFWYDENNLSTGLNTIESVIGRSFFFTGYGLGCINTGTQGFFSGSFYQRTPTNVKTNFVDFFMNSGTFYKGSGGFNQEISGMNRVGLDIYRIGTGITGLSVGLFGVGY